MRASAPLAIALIFAATGCGAGAGPRELDGLWSTGPGACEAGIGLRFAANAIDAQYGIDRVRLMERTRYTVERGGLRARVRIDYDLSPARGVLVVERGVDGRLRAVAHSVRDPRTGAARVRLDGDRVAAAFNLGQCGADAWAEGLRGRRIA